MEDDEQTLKESPELKARREKLRAYADLLLDNTISLPLPETHLDSERAAKSVIATDRMLVVVFSKPVRPCAPRQTSYSTPQPRNPKPSLVYEFDDVEDGIDDAPMCEQAANIYQEKEQLADKIYAEYLRLRDIPLATPAPIDTSKLGP